MAIKETEQKPNSPEKEAAPAKDKHEGLVKVKRGDEVLHVHPTTVKAHEEQGFAQV